MRIKVNNREQELPDEARLIDAILLVRAATADDPMLKVVRELTGGDQLSFLVNGRVVPAQEYEVLRLNDGDDVRWVHPAFGG